MGEQSTTYGGIEPGQFDNHSGRHENGGADEINVAGLSGDLADEQDPKAHASEHESGGVDEISVAGLAGQLADIQLVAIEDGNVSVSDFDTLDFGSGIDVTDNGGRATISADTTADTRTDVSDGGTTVVSDTTDINFGADLGVTDDGDGSVTVDNTSSGGRTTNLDTTITLDNTSNPAFDGTVGTIATNQTEPVRDIAVYVDSGINGNHAFNWEHSLNWDNAAGNLELELTVNWDTQPNSDVTARVEVLK